MRKSWASNPFGGLLAAPDIWGMEWPLGEVQYPAAHHSESSSSAKKKSKRSKGLNGRTPLALDIPLSQSHQ